MSAVRVVLKVEVHGQTIVLTSDDSSGDNPAFALHDVKTTLGDFLEQLSAMVPAAVVVRQR